MNKKITLLIPVAIVLVILCIFALARFLNSDQTAEIQEAILTSSQSNSDQMEIRDADIEQNETDAPTNFAASFEIFTQGTKRIFTAAMYHNQSESVYIENPDPSVVHVTVSGTTWDDFFKTLPFSLTKQCLVTGTKQTFCSNEAKKLRFYLNDIEEPNALEFQIQPEDRLKVIYD